LAAPAWDAINGAQAGEDEGMGDFFFGLVCASV